LHVWQLNLLLWQINPSLWHENLLKLPAHHLMDLINQYHKEVVNAADAVEKELLHCLPVVPE